MALVDDLLTASRRVGPHCTVGVYRATLEPAALAEFDEAIRAVHENRVTGAAFERWFKAHDQFIHASTIRRHADNGCACES